MNLTEEKKAQIDALSYEQLLRRWRFSAAGDPWFQGETGEYWPKRLEELRGEDHAEISEKIGWGTK